MKAALLGADEIYFPDPQRATAGIHFAKVLRELGIDAAVRARLRTFPNGASAMRELGRSRAAAAIGCTQVTEINYTPGVQLVAALPPQFELATEYSAGVSTQAAQPVLALALIELLAGANARALREAGGFEP